MPWCWWRFLILGTAVALPFLESHLIYLPSLRHCMTPMDLPLPHEYNTVILDIILHYALCAITAITYTTGMVHYTDTVPDHTILYTVPQHHITFACALFIYTSNALLGSYLDTGKGFLIQIIRVTLPFLWLNLIASHSQSTVWSLWVLYSPPS